MDIEARKDLIRKFGVSGIALYAHVHCKDFLLKQIADQGKVIDARNNKVWESKDLASKYADITACDVCGGRFSSEDVEPCVSYFVTSPEELELSLEIEKESVPD